MSAEGASAARLEYYRDKLGLPKKTEIFPESAKLPPTLLKDTGRVNVSRFIAHPYFGDSTYAITSSGPVAGSKVLTAEGMDYLESKRMSAAWFHVDGASAEQYAEGRTDSSSTTRDDDPAEEIPNEKGTRSRHINQAISRLVRGQCRTITQKSLETFIEGKVDDAPDNFRQEAGTKEQIASWKKSWWGKVPTFIDQADLWDLTSDIEYVDGKVRIGEQTYTKHETRAVFIERFEEKHDRKPIPEAIDGFMEHTIGKEKKKRIPKKRAGEVDVLLDLCGDFEYFNSGPMNDPYVRLTNGGHRETWPVNEIAGELTVRYLKRTGRAPSGLALKCAVDTMAAKAKTGPAKPVYVRFARGPECVHLDMCDAQWRAIKITAEDWKVDDSPDVCFVRPQGARALPLPEEGGSLEDLRDFVNVSDGPDWTLMQAWLLGAFQPAGALAHLVLEGEQGTAKSSTARSLINLIDPKDAPLSGTPSNDQDATLIARSKGIIGFDNLSGCRPSFSDLLCRLSTGQVFETRKLYENGRLYAIAVQRPAVINGIDNIAKRGDLAERSIILQLPFIPGMSRKTEQELEQAFALKHPRMLGAVLDIVSTGLRNYKTTVLPDRSRMADFCVWVSACGLPDFMQHYVSTQGNQKGESLENDQVGEVMLAWMARNCSVNSGFTLTASEILSGLNDLAQTHGWLRDRETWPRSAEAMSHWLKRQLPGLRETGWEVQRLPRTRTDRSRWQIFKLGGQPSLPLQDVA